ncbi:uncharacterized protein LOC142569087 isoform X3 [Dermacentor variabilis]
MAFTELLPPLKLSSRNGTQVTATQRLFPWLHSAFGAILTSREIPRAIKEEGRMKPDLLFQLVVQWPGPVIFAVFALLLTVAVPLSGLAVLRKRCKERHEEKETTFTNPPDSVGKTTSFIWILLLCLTLLKVFYVRTITIPTSTSHGFTATVLTGLGLNSWDKHGVLQGIGAADRRFSGDDQLIQV